jgi:hypothetical protein
MTAPLPKDKILFLITGLGGCLLIGTSAQFAPVRIGPSTAASDTISRRKGRRRLLKQSSILWRKTGGSGLDGPAAWPASAREFREEQKCVSFVILAVLAIILLLAFAQFGPSFFSAPVKSNARGLR